MKQKFNNDCLFASFNYLANKYHKKKIKYQEFYLDIYNDLIPLNLVVADEFSKYFGLEIEAYETDNLNDLEEFDILQISLDKEHNHFVVLLKNDEDHVVIFDPEKGKVKYDKFTFMQLFLGSFIRCEPTEVKHYSTNYSMSDTYNNIVMFSNFLVGLITTFITILSTSYLKIILTDIQPKSDLNLLIKVTLVIVFFASISLSSNYSLDKINSKYSKVIMKEEFNYWIHKLRSTNKVTNYNEYFSDVELKTRWKYKLNTGIILNSTIVVTLSMFFYIYNSTMFLLVVFLIGFKYVSTLLNDSKLKKSLIERHIIQEKVNNWQVILNNNKQRIMNNNDWNWYSKNLLQNVYLSLDNEEKHYVICLNRGILQSFLGRIGEIMIIGISTYMVITRGYNLSLIFISSLAYSYLSKSSAMLLDAKREFEEIKISMQRLTSIRSKEIKQKGIINSISLADIKYLDVFKNISYDFKNYNDIIGTNGAGKTTICRILKGEIRDYKGEIYINGKADKLEHYSDRVLFVSGDDPIYPSDARSNIFRGKYHNARYNKILMTYKINLAKSLKTTTTEISLGQKQIINILSIFEKDFDVLILDEAFSNISKQNRKYLIEMIKSKYKNKIIIGIGHDYEISNNKLEVTNG